MMNSHLYRQVIGVPKEIKNHENRVGATPAMVAAFAKDGHKVLVQTQAGAAIGFSDEMYLQAGAEIVSTPLQVYVADLIIKVKEPQPSEYSLLREGQVLFCYLHLAPDPEQTKALLDRKVIGIAYETVIDRDGRLPLLTPMSEIAGRIAIQAGAVALQMSHGGKGVLLGGVPGVLPGKVTIVGGGIVGKNAARMAVGLGADVVILDNHLGRLRELDAEFGSSLKTVYSNHQNIYDTVVSADLVIGAVLLPGKTTPKLVTKEMVQKMQKGSVVVDVAIDQGGCMETSRPTTHTNPTYILHDVVHYCVTNMPGACAYTATQALTNATFPYARKIANLGYQQALMSDLGFMQGLNVFHGKVTNEYVALDLNYDYFSASDVLKS